MPSGPPARETGGRHPIGGAGLDERAVSRVHIEHVEGEMAVAQRQHRVDRRGGLQTGAAALAVQELDAIPLGRPQHHAGEVDVREREVELDLESQRRAVPRGHSREVGDVQPDVVEPAGHDDPT
jgi:hypothetical protein